MSHPVSGRLVRSSLEKIIAKGELLSQHARRQIGGIEIGKHETRIVAPRQELAEVILFGLERAVVDLQLLCIKTVNYISGVGVRIDVVREIKRKQWQRHIVIRPQGKVAVRTRGKIRIRGSAVERARRLVEQRSVIVLLSYCDSVSKPCSSPFAPGNCP